MHDASFNQFGDLRMIEDRAIEHAGVLHGPPHDLGVGDGVFCIGKGDGPPFDQLTDLGQFLTGVVFCDRTQRIDIAVVCPFGLQEHEFRGGSIVDDG